MENSFDRKHDWLCPSHYTFGVCECDLIATARQDERARIIAMLTPDSPLPADG